ncbi:MAG: phosphoenolpyruvate carboxykinase (ATP) [Saprospiraceae bacterium]|nr:phosphoenolpyruvate carboxykinase (ATP) [Saprospiraceae bacterium]
MKETGLKNPQVTLLDLGLEDVRAAYWNQSPEMLMEQTICRNMGVLSDTGALVVETGKFTGRSPKDRFIVKDAKTANAVDWNAINISFEPENYASLRTKILDYFKEKEVFIRDAYACADPEYRMNLRLVSEYPWSNLFAYNMFLRPGPAEIASFEAEWSILCAPGFEADPAIDGTRAANFAIINFSAKEILIGGTGYTGEIKKGIFSVLNFVLPHEKNVLSMHCSANVGAADDVAVFFGLSGTGKTTLSADPSRALIGDDEHGWSENGIFNFEGGCYAKTINLSAETEPEIYGAIRHGAILENIRFFKDTRVPDYENDELTENTRVSYPIHFIPNALVPSYAGLPKNIFFLTCDAFGVLPPISKLNPSQAMYHFISGYTAKVAGTEEGITEPEATFSACFGAPFMPLHPTAYADMLGKKIQEHQVNIWLVNTGWTGGGYGEGTRMKLRYTRAMIHAALDGQLMKVPFENMDIFGLKIPTACPGVPDELLNPRNTWANKDAYDAKTKSLAIAFEKNFSKFADQATPEMLKAAPVIPQNI